MMGPAPNLLEVLMEGFHVGYHWIGWENLHDTMAFAIKYTKYRGF